MKYNYSYDSDKDLKNCKCKVCGSEIKDDEFEYEDYFVIFRGYGKNSKVNSKSCFEGFVCFACAKEKGRIVGA